ncbi:hypothetical protein PNOK_0274700 [Pyrrhoderma noxium]|uniref:Uncharacterized protein n=1 Tax=Pyrrhoderma noxium TaxID=2282107 RepID=A0A286UT70_9AGAM|nr:hypothetical protein PNOK_0274700 [Pyrrhoderma noxium]
MSGSNDNSTASTSSSSSSTSSSSSSASSSASSSGYKPTSSRSTLPLFTPASESFNPRPYHPHASSSVNRNRSSSQASSSRQTLTASGSQPKAPKSIYEDTGNVIIRAPFDVFPGCESCPEGLTYRHFQENPNWYLHIDDFRKEGEGRVLRGWYTRRTWSLGGGGVPRARRR